MDLRPYVETIHDQLTAAAEAGGEDARALAERLVAPLDASIRLAMQDVLAAAAEEITTELAPGSVELRLRGHYPELVVILPPVEATADDTHGNAVPRVGGEADDGAMSRINLRMPDAIKARIERAADSQGVSVNAWLLRAATALLDRGELDQRLQPRNAARAQRYTGWAR